MSSSLWVVHKVDSGLLCGVSRHTQHTRKAAVCAANHLVMVPIFSVLCGTTIILRVYKLGTTNKQQLAVASEGLLLFGLWSELLLWSTVEVHYIQVQRQHFHGVQFFWGARLRAGEGIRWLAAGTMPNSLYRMPLAYLSLTCVFCYSCSFLFVVCVFVFFFALIGAW